MSPRRAAISSEVRVGLLFFLGLGLMIWFTFFVNSLGGASGEYRIRFRKVSQLRDGDPVTYNGVRVGTIAEVSPELIDGSPMVGVRFAIDKEFLGHVLIGPETIWRINLGVLGGGTLEIISTGGKPVKEADLSNVTGTEPVGIGEAIASIREVVEENRADINRAVKAFGDASTQVAGLVQENRETVKSALANIDTMSGQVGEMVKENRDTVKTALTNVARASDQIAEMVKENRNDLKLALAALPATVQNVGDAAKRIEDTIAANQEGIRKAIDGIAAFAPRLDRIGANLEVITRQISEGKGSIGKLVMEDDLHDKAVGAVDSFAQRLEEVKPITSTLSDLKFYAGVSGGINLDNEVETGHAYVRIEPRSWKYYQAGVSYRTSPRGRDTLPEDDDLPITLDLLLGWRFFPDDDDQNYHLTIAGGVIESKLGAKIEVPIWGRYLGLVGMARQKDNDREALHRLYEDGSALVRATLDYRPWERYGFYLSAGVDDLVDDPRPWVGIRAEILDNDLRNLATVSSFAP
ncbi:MAG: MCE family protein [Planctomycetes bacterium]|nr:MCE family protein [Planctomycetota bacterium]